MCGRYVLSSTLQELADVYDAIPEGFFELEPAYNITPDSDRPVITVDEESRERLIRPYKWGLVPSWSREEKTRYSMINARAETLAKKPAYRDAYRKRRCVVPANGFYEWRSTSEGKQPYLIHQKEMKLLSMAGLYEHWERDGKRLNSFTIITTPANRTMEPLHDRMPALLLDEEAGHWLDPQSKTGELKDLLRPSPDDYIDWYPVSKAVNNPGNQGPELIKRSTLL